MDPKQQPYSVLIVEDDATIRRFVRLALSSEGYTVFEAGTRARGLTEMATRQPDVVVLDLGLPDGDGVDFIRDLRTWSDRPVIVLSARTQESDKIAALDAGANDYLTKPFGVGELMARLRAQLRALARHTGTDEASPLLRFGAIEVDWARRSVSRDGLALHLTPIEYGLLRYLCSQPDRVITHRQLLQAVWGPGHSENSHYVRVHMANLRQKIEADPSQPRHLRTELGVGYRFVL